jgi:hypothetical protein
MITQATDAEHTTLLAQKPLWLTGLLTFALPFAGYLYAGRPTFALLSFGLWVPCVALGDSPLPLAPSRDLLTCLMVGTTAENLITLFKARRPTVPNPIRPWRLPRPQPQPPDLTLTLLKTLKAQGETALAECVIATESAIDDVRTCLHHLETQDLIRSRNRDSDGAIVYRIVG